MKFLALVFIALYLFSFLGYSKGMEEAPSMTTVITIAQKWGSRFL
jgi:hypothetical protein